MPTFAPTKPAARGRIANWSFEIPGGCPPQTIRLARQKLTWLLRFNAWMICGMLATKRVNLMTMTAFRIFFDNFWPTFIGAAVMFPLLHFGRRKSLDGNAVVFIGPSSFRELSAFPDDKQKRLLHEADREAFARWRFFVPSMVFVVIFSASLGIGTTIQKVSSLPDSFWVRTGLGLGLFLICSWVASRWEAHSVRRFLRSHIEGAKSEAQ